jgi:hypothetical protein
MMRLRLGIAGALIALNCAACMGGVGQASEGTVPPLTATNTPPATEVIWFPATETPVILALPTGAPTPERKPGIGELIISDDMTSNTHWNAATSGEASALVSERGLTISAQPEGQAVISLHRSAVFDDMYMEMTARPSLCREKDSYGLVFRAPNDVAHYRFLAICDGSAAAERISLGAPRILQPPVPSADVPVGAPGEVRLGVWASGAEFRFFLNGRYQFTATDASYAAGGVGVFVQAAGETPAVVTFSELAVHSLLDSFASPPPP